MNENERLWAGDFGNAYHARNKSQQSRMDFWSTAVGSVLHHIKSVTELGAGCGDNLVAMRCLIPAGRYVGVEINHKACEVMKKRKLTVIEAAVTSALHIPSADLVITRGFLIHVPEHDLDTTLKLLYAASSRFICIAEYFSPVRREVVYRGYPSALWTDDYARRLMELFPNLKLLDYGFVYHSDGADDLTWFLLEKKSGSVNRSLLK